MGIIITESGVRIPVPRRSYYTQAYCKEHGKKYRTQAQLIALMIREAMIPKDVDVTVVYDSAFDADIIHKECRKRGFREVFPLDPNRNLAECDRRLKGSHFRRFSGSQLRWLVGWPCS